VVESEREDSDDEPLSEVEDDSDSDSESDTEDTDDDHPGLHVDIDMYEEEEKRVDFDPSIKSTACWTQWQNALKRVFNAHINGGKLFKKQKASFEA
jgi:hypothetical protein